MAPRFRVMSLEDIEEIPVVGGTIRWKPIRSTLDVRAFGINAYAADAGQDVVEEHDEAGPPGAGGHEELYLVVAGHARFTVDGEAVEAPTGTMVFLKEPSVRRSAQAVQDGTTVLAIGAPVGEPYSVSPWELWFSAEPDLARGDFDAAVEKVRAGLPEHEGNPALHYNLACFLARGGRHEEALRELSRAFEADPEQVREWAATDGDLDPLRGLPGFPA